MPKRILDVGATFGFGVERIFIPWEPEIIVPISFKDVEAAIESTDLVCLGGGADICPAIYGHTNVASHTDTTPSRRDMFEMAVWRLAEKYHKPILGICRGAQMACALSGGVLIQDNRGHPSGTHTMETSTGDHIEMTSVHHQMMHPGKVKHDLLAWLNVPDPRSRRYQFDWHKMPKVTITQEPEVVFFPKQRALAIQGHPEYFAHAHPTSVWVRNLVDQHLLGVATHE